MADGRDDNFNFPARRGSKLRNQGAKNTGAKPYYSEEMNHRENVALTKRTRMTEDDYLENQPSSEQCQDEGLNFKRPLS